ncbi:MAG TPA: hypothetical protein VG937_32175 [Polyangiaceae bacterium]|nr:hypothetical protein [Polyangiaceae bacterium]
MSETQRRATYKDPSWWNNNHTSSWDRTKEALRRDWEQTKADLTEGGHELNQDVGDTVKQSVGKEAIPPSNRPNPPSDRDDWDDFEPAVRYGYGARQYYGAQPWNDELEVKLRKDWDDSGSSNAWERIKAAVRRGWESVKS